MLAAALVLPMTAHAATIAEKKAAIQQVEAETLNKLYSLHPDAQREIQNAAGYAVFSNGSLAFIWLSGGYGHGVAHNNRTNEDIYMQMASAGVGLGLGAKEYNTIFVFHTEQAFNDFTITGLDLSAHGDAAAKVGERGAAASGAADIIPGVRMYQITETGLMAQAMVKGTRYWRDDELNGPTASQTTTSYERSQRTTTRYEHNN
jgi:lipid-binding SYLF domain-containing protein